jgi:hypothetical protein
MNKPIYHYNPISGTFLGSDMARESPLELGVFLVPANATTNEPPRCSASERPVYRDGAWTVEPIPQPLPEPSPIEPDPANVIRAERVPLLTAADIAILKAEDSNQDTANWRQYRQALRDITGQSGFPEKVKWPKVPM